MGVHSVLDPRRILSDPRLYRIFQGMVRSDGSRLVDQILKIRTGQRVLDIGCGPADILDRLPADIEYCGFDMESRYIEEARARYANRGSFFVRAVTPETVDDLGTFDVVISIGVLHHLNDIDAGTVFASAARVLRPEGRLITIDGAFVKGQNPIARLLLKMDRGRFVRAPEAYLKLASQQFPMLRRRSFTIYLLCLIRTASWKRR